MLSDQFHNRWKESDKVIPVAIAVILIFFGNVVVDEILVWKGVQAAETFLNDIGIAAVGGLTVWALLTIQERRQEMLRARERMQLTIELNRHVRNAFSMMANSLLLKNEEERLRVIDDAMQQIDRVLTEVVPAGGVPLEPRPVAKQPVNPSFQIHSQPNATRQN